MAKTKIQPTILKTGYLDGDTASLYHNTENGMYYVKGKRDVDPKEFAELELAEEEFNNLNATTIMDGKGKIVAK